jgi:Flp pilus assembly protein TadD
MEKSASSSTTESQSAMLGSLLQQAGSVLTRGQTQEALRIVEDGLKSFPDSAELCNIAGVCAAKLGDQDKAEHYWLQAVTIHPNAPQPRHNLGLLYAQRERCDEAERYYRSAIALNPGVAGIYSDLGVLLANTGRYDEAEQCYRKTIELDPSIALAYSNLGILLTERDRLDEAEQYYRKAVELDAANIGVLSNFGNLLKKIGKFEEAELYYRKIIALAPHDAAGYIDLAVLLSHIKRDEEAEHYYRQAITLDPHSNLNYFNLSHLLLRQGRFSEGWRHYEARYALESQLQHKFITPIQAPFPQWRGEPLAGKSLLVWPEQGFGDEIQYCRYIPLLKKQGASRITLLCKRPLKPLIETLEGVDEVVDFDDADAVIEAHDYWTYLLSIPLHHKTTTETIPSRIPYLRALPDRVAKWSARLPRDGFRVGLVWKGGTTYLNDRNRSLAGLASMAPLWTVPGVHFVSLQKGPGQEEAQHPPAGRPLLDLGREIGDFADTAAIVEQLDLVISVDTAVAHLAGALATPCWILLPAYGADWRWLQGRDDSPWYPGVCRLFRQTVDKDWETVVLNITNALRDKLTNRQQRD